jgi:hypothetical protein
MAMNSGPVWFVADKDVMNKVEGYSAIPGAEPTRHKHIRPFAKGTLLYVQLERVE